MAMISQEGAPSLKVSFQITHIPSDGGDEQGETCRLRHSLQVEEDNDIPISDAYREILAPISSADIYIRMRRPSLWNHADMVDACGTILQGRFQQTDDIDEISNAISAHQRAVHLTPDGHVDMPDRLSNLGISFLLRFRRTGDLADMADSISSHQRAIQLSPDGHANLPTWLNNLGNSFLNRFGRTGDLTDIANAISAHKRAVQLTPNGHVKMPTRLNNLGNSFSCSFRHTSDLIDIANAIAAHQRAFQLTPDGHADRPTLLNNLGNSFSNRFKRTGDLTDMVNAISIHQRAVQLTPDGHASMPRQLSNLGNSFVSRFEHSSDLVDISDAILAHQMAVELAPNGHVNIPMWLNNLGNSLSIRFGRTGDLTDISDSISALQRAVQLMPDGHANKPSLISSLGTSFLRRFEHTGDFADITNSILAYQRAIRLTPDGHALIPSWLNKLGNSFAHRFECTGDLSDILTAISSYRQSTTCNAGRPSVRLVAAQCWAELSVSHNPIDSLKAYDVVVSLLSQIAGMEMTIQQRHSSLVGISKLTATAASTAFSQGELGKALEWLEQGRCLVWNQLNQLRTSVDDLRLHNHLLADRFLHVSRALESSGSRQESEPIVLDGTISEKVVLEDEAHSHAMLAQDWEQLLQEIRNIPAFHDFLRPRSALDIMKHLPKDGPVVLINVHEDRCDALALIPGCDQPYHIPLNDLTHAYASVLRNRLRSYLSSRGCRMREVADRATRPAPNPNANKSDIHNILHELWSRVAKPILDILAYPVRLFWIYNMQLSVYSLPVGPPV